MSAHLVATVLYDIRKPCVGSLCYDFSNLEKFLNQKSVRESLGVGDRVCFMQPNCVSGHAIRLDEEP
jgi:hypothetical protein